MRVFISYNSRDLPRIEPVVDALRTLRPDWDAYFAPIHNGLGAYWIRDLGEQLAQSDTILLFLGKTVGPWQEIEFYDAWHRSRGQGLPRILPILLEDKAPALFFLGQLHRLNAKSLPSSDIARIIARNEPLEKQTPLWREVNPYAGLSSQRTESAALFFGRESKTVEILNHLRRGSGSIKVLVGKSGVGKSSIVTAGVLSALRSQQWPVASETWPEDLGDSRTWLFITLKPGEMPARELAKAFAATWTEDYDKREKQARLWHNNFSDGFTLDDLVQDALRKIAISSGGSAPGRILLNIDQAEELYTSANLEDARLFAHLIAQGTANPDLLVIASLRADYYGDLQEDADLFPNSTRIDIPPLTAAETEEVIRQPAQQLGAEFATPEILPHLARATVASPGGMPLLSFMLTRAWEQMRNDPASDGKLHLPANPLDIAHPLISRAEAFLRQNPSAENALHRLFTLRLAHVPKNGEAVRRRARKEDCQEDEWAIAAELAKEDWRLLTTSERDGTPMAEVAHETLLRTWPRLTQWLETEREFLVWKGTLEAARQEHIANPGTGTLLMGTPLEKAREWLSAKRNVLSTEDQSFIEISLEAEDKRKQQVKDREADLAATQERARARLIWMVRGTIAAVILVGGAAVFAMLQWNTAKINLTKTQIEIEQRQIEKARYAVQKANEFLSLDEPDSALSVAVSAFPSEAPDRWPDIDQSSSASQPLEQAWSKAATLAVLRGHELPLFLAAFSTDGARIVTGSQDAIQIWDALTGGLIRTLDIPDLLQMIVLSNNSAHIFASSVSTYGFGIWNIASGDLVCSTKEKLGFLSSAEFSPDGTRIITVDRENGTRIWDAVTCAEIRRLPAGANNSASFSPDGSRIVTTSDDNKTARIWHAGTGTEILILKGHMAEVNSADFSPDGTRIITTSDDKTGRIWDAETGEWIHTLRGHESWVINAAFSPDGTRIVTASTDDTARVWDAETGTEIQVLSGNKIPVDRPSFSPNGTRIVTGATFFFTPDNILVHDNTARIWDVEAGSVIQSLRGHENDVRSALYSPDGTRIVTASVDKTARIWDVKTFTQIDGLRGHEGSVQSAAISSDNKRIITASNDRTARIWNAANGSELLTLRGHENSVQSAAFSSDGARIVTASLDGSARIWDAANGVEIYRLNRHGDSVLSATFSPDDTRVVTASDDKTTRLWDAHTGAEILSLRHESAINSATFSPDGTRILTASDDSTARVWDTAKGTENLTMHGHEDSVLSANFSHDGTLIVTASRDRTARIWSARTGKEMLVLRGHSDWVQHAIFSPDGTRIATASKDGTARLWDANTGEEIRRFNGHLGSVFSVGFSGDGTHVITASADQTARLWSALSLEELVIKARKRDEQAGVLSHEERCALYLSDDSCP